MNTVALLTALPNINWPTLYPYLGLVAIVLTLGREGWNSWRSKDWKDTAAAQDLAIKAMETRMETMEGEIVDLKAHAMADSKTIATLRRERTNDKATIVKLRQQVAQLVAALKAANIPIPMMLPFNEALEKETSP